MTGIFLFLVMCIWFVVALTLAFKVSGCFFNSWKRALVCCVMFLVMLPLPLVDEFLAKDQFKTLCEAHTNLIFDPQSAAGKTIYLVGPIDQNIDRTWVPMRLAEWRFREVNTNELVASFEIAYAKAGILGRSLGLTQTPSPFLFNGYCEPPGRDTMSTTFNKLEIRQVKQPKN
ncbi:hypothetical protein [Undibacterium sp.]|uniref:hypothetical protein n=1 Tax=Undibacterium sp. TaxID=1914977 RepID=UPI00374D029C